MATKNSVSKKNVATKPSTKSTPKSTTKAAARKPAAIKANALELHKQQLQLDAINATQIIVEFDLNGSIEFANDNFCKRFSYAVSELAGKHHRSLLEDTSRSRSEWEELWSNLLNARAISGDFHWIDRNGKTVWLQGTFTPLADARKNIVKVIFLATDVTEKYLMQTELEELRVHAQIVNMTSIVSVADLKGDIVSINEKFIEVSKYSREELIGKPHNTTRHPDMPKDVFKELWSSIGRGNTFRGVIKNRAKDGTPYYVDAVIAPVMGKNGKPQKYIGVRYDITASEIERQNANGILNAIDSSFAFIEFTTDGNIVNANKLFLHTMGYRLDEVVGKHHRTLVESSYANSNTYAQFWDDLKAGQSKSEVFKRLTKDGKEVWLQAIYAPVKDEMGRVYKIIKIATDVSIQKQMEFEIADRQRKDAAFASEQQAKVAQILNSVKAIADGDFSVDVPNLGTDAVGQIASALQSAISGIRTSLVEVSTVSGTVALAAQQLSGASREISSGAQTQASSLEETASSLEEITSTVKQNSDNAQQARQLANGSRDIAEKGGAVVSDAVNAMAEINKSSKKIADIITTIDEIAFQTNLLALNAAVEAARAGEQGRGFAVVAAEVRNLAQRSASAAKEIKSLIQDSVSRVENGTNLVNKSGETLSEIVNSVKRVTDIVSEIAAASKEQLTGIEQVNKAVAQMDRVTQANASQTEEVSGTAESLLSHAEQLREEVSKFNLGEDTVATTKSTRTPVAVGRGGGRQSQPTQTRKTTPVLSQQALERVDDGLSQLMEF